MAEAAGGESFGLLIVTGLSGAGRTTTINALEDLSYEAITNFPLSLVDALLADHGPGARPLALSVETRTRGFSAEALAALPGRLRERMPERRVLLVFLDCDDTTISRRFSETRRRHPLAPAEDVETGVARERDLLARVRASADLLIDTSGLTPHDLKAEIGSRFRPAMRTGTGEAGAGLVVTINSFSYRRGVPEGCDVVIDCRFLRNPYWQPDLRERDGRDAAVQDYVAGDPRYAAFFDKLFALLTLLLPAYREEGKVYFSVALGCTGGRHRSVTVAEQLAQRLDAEGWPAGLRHRELSRPVAGSGIAPALMPVKSNASEDVSAAPTRSDRPPGSPPSEDRDD